MTPILGYIHTIGNVVPIEDRVNVNGAFRCYKAFSAISVCHWDPGDLKLYDGKGVNVHKSRPSLSTSYAIMIDVLWDTEWTAAVQQQQQQQWAKRLRFWIDRTHKTTSVRFPFKWQWSMDWWWWSNDLREVRRSFGIEWLLSSSSLIVDAGLLKWW